MNSKQEKNDVTGGGDNQLWRKTVKFKANLSGDMVSFTAG